MSKIKLIHILFWSCLTVALITGCSGLSQQSAPTPEPVVEDEFSPVVSVTGMIVPARWARLSPNGAGIISALPISEGEMVASGQTLMGLQGQEKLQAAVAAARLELALAQRALDDLYKDPEMSLASASQAIVDAKLAIRDAERRVKNLSTSSAQADIDQARAVVALAKDKLEKAEEDYKPYAKKPEDNIVRAGYLNKKAQAEKDYDAAVRRLNNLLGKTANPLDLEEALSDLDLAQAQLAVAERDYQIYVAGPDPVDVTLAEERIANAQAQLVAAQSALADLALLAPLDGTVIELYAREGEWVSPGQVVMLLADLKHLRVETTDLNEIDVARIKVGDAATLTFDSLPDTVAAGKVTRIASKASEGSGVNYTVVIELDEVPEALRWGMTAFADITVD